MKSPSGEGNELESPVEYERVEYFYLEDPKIPKDRFPVKIYGIFDRVTVNKNMERRLKDDVIKMLGRVEKFGVMRTEEEEDIECKSNDALIVHSQD